MNTINDKPDIEDTWRARLGSIDLYIRSDGQFQIEMEGAPPDELVGILDAWNPEYENTNVIRSTIEMLTQNFNNLNRDIRDHLRSLK